MLLTVIGFLAFAAIIGVLLHASKAERCPLWVPVLLLALIELLRILPLGK